MVDIFSKGVGRFYMTVNDNLQFDDENMVFMKTSNGTQTCQNAIFLNTGKVGLNWSLEATFAS